MTLSQYYHLPHILKIQTSVTGPHVPWIFYSNRKQFTMIIFWHVFISTIYKESKTKRKFCLGGKEEGGELMWTLGTALFDRATLP